MTISYENQEGNEYTIQQEMDLKVRLLWLYGLFATSILAGLLLFAYIARNRLEQDAKTADLTLANVIAAQIDSTRIDNVAFESQIMDLLIINGEEPTVAVLIVTPNGEIIAQYESNADVSNSSLGWRSWQRDAIRRTINNPASTYISNDPVARRWLHVSAEIASENTYIILQRPTQSAFGTSIVLNRGLFIAVLIFLGGGVAFWTYLSRDVINPLAQLETLSGIIRWRGRIRTDEQKQINNLSKRSDQIGSLARSLLAMKEDISERFRQLSTLLETGRIVASSLDVAEVINNILDQVQELLEVERCAVVVLDQRLGMFRIRASRGLSEAYAEQLRIAPTEPNSPSMRALRNHEPIQVSNTETDLAYASFRPRARKEGVQSVLAIPLETQHAPPAVLLIYKAEPYRYSYSELEMASSFAYHASIAMDNAALYARTDERLQEQTSKLESIIESLNDGLILESPSGQVLYCNQQAADLCGLPRSIARRRRSDDLIQQLFYYAADQETAVKTFTTVSSDSGTRSFDLAQVFKDGRSRDLRISIFDVTDANGVLLGRGQLWQDITLDKELDRVKSALLSTVSHELRTPLATIKGYATTLLAKDIEWDAAAQREFLETISSETDRLTTLVKNLLDMSRIEAGLLNMHCEPFSLNDVLTQVIQGFRPPLESRLSLHLAPKLAPVSIDVPRIGTAVRNLINNAIKYSPPDSKIELKTQQLNGFVQFTVRDFGPGVSPELQDKIFDRFFRADNRLTRQVGGTGLGLAICKGFVEAHGGQVWVTDANPGAIFGFKLPLRDNAESNQTDKKEHS